MRPVRGEIILAVAQKVLQEISLDHNRIISELLEELRVLRQAQAGGAGNAQKIQTLIQRQLDRRDRAQEAYLDGDLSRSDMRRLTLRCEEEAARLRELLESAKKQQAEHGADRFEEIRAMLERELAGGERVLDEVIEQITVYDDYFIVEVTGLPVRFRIRAEGHGTGQDFRVTITECTPDSAVQKTMH